MSKKPSKAKPPATTKPKKSPNRPPYDREAVVNDICKQLCQGIPMARICEPVNMPNVTTVWLWEEEDKSIAQRIARARVIGAHKLVGEAVEIADAPPGKTHMGVIDQGDVQNRKLRIWTRFEQAKRIAPERFGDKVSMEHTGAGGGPVQIANVPLTEAQRKILDSALDREY